MCLGLVHHICCMEINFKSVKDILDFVNIVSRFSENVDVSTKRTLVDGKSILGLFSLDLSQPVVVTTQSEQIYAAIQKYTA